MKESVFAFFQMIGGWMGASEVQTAIIDQDIDLNIRYGDEDLLLNLETQYTCAIWRDTILGGRFYIETQCSDIIDLTGDSSGLMLRTFDDVNLDYKPFRNQNRYLFQPLEGYVQSNISVDIDGQKYPISNSPLKISYKDLFDGVYTDLALSPVNLSTPIEELLDQSLTFTVNVTTSFEDLDVQVSDDINDVALTSTINRTKLMNRLCEEKSSISKKLVDGKYFCSKRERWINEQSKKREFISSVISSKEYFSSGDEEGVSKSKFYKFYADISDQSLLDSSYYTVKKLHKTSESKRRQYSSLVKKAISKREKAALAEERRVYKLAKACEKTCIRKMAKYMCIEGFQAGQVFTSPSRFGFFTEEGCKALNMGPECYQTTLMQIAGLSKMPIWDLSLCTGRPFCKPEYVPTGCSKVNRY